MILKALEFQTFDGTDVMSSGNSSGIFSKSWFTNSLEFSNHYTKGKIAMIWLTFIVSVLFLIHSFVINRKRRTKIRNFTETVLLLTILNCIMLFAAGTTRNSHSVIIYEGLIAYGLLECGIQAVDNYFIYILHCATESVPMRERVFIHAYTWLNIFCYLPFVTLFPIFCDVNRTSTVFTLYTTLGKYCWSGLFIIFKVYFGWKIWYIIQKRYSSSDRMNSVAMLSYRNIAHLKLV